MATVVFVEKDGQRIDISDAERIIETRCDGCGEYTPAYDVAQVNLTVNRGGITLASSFLEGHLDHILEKLAERIAAMAVAHKP